MHVEVPIYSTLLGISLSRKQNFITVFHFTAILKIISTLCATEKLKNLAFEIPIIPQNLSINY